MARIQTARRRHRSLQEFSGLSDEEYYWGPADWQEPDTAEPAVSIGNGRVDTDPDARMHTSEIGINYYTSLPDGAKRCLTYTQFYRLKQNAKTWKKDNIELQVGMYFLIYSPESNVYFLRQVHDTFNPDNVKRYIADKNLYLINP